MITMIEQIRAALTEKAAEAARQRIETAKRQAEQDSEAMMERLQQCLQPRS